MDKELELALVKNLILKTKIVIGFFGLYFLLSQLTIYTVFAREIEILIIKVARTW